MRIAITGATGMIGRRLTDFFSAKGDHVTAITRRSSLHQSGVIVWDPDLNYLETMQLEAFDVVVNLAGASIGEYWTPDRKKQILNSGVVPTKFLCDNLALLNLKPKILISASAVGFYGNHPAEVQLDERDVAGQGFLADICRQWEQATVAASLNGIRVVHLRFGVVLSKEGGALRKMQMPFKLGLGGVLGHGRQMISWIALDEIPFVVEHVINSALEGPVNAVAPQAASNLQLTKALGEVMHRPAVLPVPGFAVRLMFGEMGQNLLLEGANVVPRRLMESGYQFHYPDLKQTLQKALE